MTQGQVVSTGATLAGGWEGAQLLRLWWNAYRGIHFLFFYFPYILDSEITYYVINHFLFLTLPKVVDGICNDNDAIRFRINLSVYIC